MAPKTGTKSVSATISAENFNAIEEFRWSVRKNLSQIVDQAITEFITAHAIPVKLPEDAPADEVPTNAELVEAVTKSKR